MRFVCLAAVVLAGCAPSLSGANERGGQLTNYSAGKTKAFEKADAHCRQYGRVARVSGTGDWLTDTMTFDCVEK